VSVDSSFGKPLPKPAVDKLLVDDLNGIQYELAHHGYMSKEEQAATQKFLDDLKPLTTTERIAAAHRANMLELHEALQYNHDPYVYFPSWKDGKLTPQYMQGSNPLTSYTKPMYGHMLDDNTSWLDKDLVQIKKEEDEAAAKEAARKKLMGK